MLFIGLAGAFIAIVGVIGIDGIDGIVGIIRVSWQGAQGGGVEFTITAQVTAYGSAGRPGVSGARQRLSLAQRRRLDAAGAGGGWSAWHRPL